MKISQKKIDEEKIRIDRDMREFETLYSDLEYICGIDEAGRGPLAGPVVAGAVILPKNYFVPFLNDSKKITEKRRDWLFDKIKEDAIAYGIGIADEKEIDEINILNATYKAMERAVKALKVKPDILLNDAVIIPGIDIKQEKIIKGDQRSISIAAASVLAKVTRDRLMIEYSEKYPEYGFEKHKGYGTALHREKIRELGACEIHRQSFLGKILGG